MKEVIAIGEGEERSGIPYHNALRRPLSMSQLRSNSWRGAVWPREAERKSRKRRLAKRAWEWPWIDSERVDSVQGSMVMHGQEVKQDGLRNALENGAR